MTDASPPKRHSVSIDTRVVAILTRVRDRVIAEMLSRLRERQNAGRNELAEAEIEMIARIAGTLARNAADEAVSAAHEIVLEHAMKEARAAFEKPGV